MPRIFKEKKDVETKDLHLDNSDTDAFPDIHANEVALKSSERKQVEKLPEANVEEESYAGFPKLTWDKLGNYEKMFPKRSGVGEYGKAVYTTAEEKSAVDASIKEFGFNLIASDKVSLDRLPKDLRHEECRHWDYPSKMSDISVIIVFHNEGWSPLVRTVHSVINMTPKDMLAEIVMIDDHSSKDHLGRKLADYIEQFNGIVKLYRNDRREGLIRARSIGAQKTKAGPGRILIYLDAHCEVGYNWLPPLVMPIMKNRQVTTVPLIDSISGNQYTFQPQAGGDANGFARGAWDWSLMWKRVPLGKKERERREHTTEPYRSPAMAGGLFAIDREYFFDIGMYDPGLEIWGGENFELSFKIWMTGGEVLFVPCSRVGHIYRMPGWSGNPPPEYVPSNPSLRNYVRVIETWWDEFSVYFYASRPETMDISYGDISEQVKYRQTHNSRSFKWFMENIAYDILEHFPLPPKNKLWGEVRAVGTKNCIDSMGHKNADGAFEVGYCHRMGGNQLFRLNEADQLSQYDQCVTVKSGMVTQVHCDSSQYREWSYNATAQMFQHKASGKCLERGDLTHKLFIGTCDKSKNTQQWEINKVSGL